MRARILDLDRSVTAQRGLLRLHQPDVVDLRGWGPALRMVCPWRRFHRFERALDRHVGPAGREVPSLTFYGSGDFHHVTLALLRRLRGPFNLLILDKHPDWMRGVPVLHCGTWVRHALRLPQLRQVFHVGGETDFDNAYRWLAPKAELRSGRIVPIPAVRTFHAGWWKGVPHSALRRDPLEAVTASRLQALLWPYRDALSCCPLYVSVDKDVLMAPAATVNWDSGFLTLDEVAAVIDAFRRISGHPLAGADVCGDWSAVETTSWLGRTLHRLEHPPLDVNPYEATRRNQQANLALASMLAAEAVATSPRYARAA
jgi:hypothetical protein